jgi:hypothetical protein
LNDRFNSFRSDVLRSSFIIYSKERNFFLRADSLRTMDMCFRAVQMHADLARGGDGFTLLSMPVSASPQKGGRLKRGNTLSNSLDKAAQALEELERAVCAESKNQIDEPDSSSNNYYVESKQVTMHGKHDEDPHDPEITYESDSHPQFIFKPHKRDPSIHVPVKSSRLEDSFESQDSLEIAPVQVRKPPPRNATSRTKAQESNRESNDEDPIHSQTSSRDSREGNRRAWG